MDKYAANAAAPAYAGQVQTATTGYLDTRAVQPTRLETAAEHLGKMQAGFSDLNGRLARLADRLAGMVPEPVEKNGISGGPTCTAHRLELITEDFGGTLRRMDALVSRIEAL